MTRNNSKIRKAWRKDRAEARAVKVAERKKEREDAEADFQKEA